MLLSRINDQINVIVQDIFEWMEIFDSGLVNEIQFNLDEDSLDFFCPKWRSYIDRDNPFETLRTEDAKQIKYIKIVTATDLKDIRGDDLTEGEGIYEVTDYRFDIGYDEAEEILSDDLYAEFLNYAGLVTFTVKPDLPGF